MSTKKSFSVAEGRQEDRRGTVLKSSKYCSEAILFLYAYQHLYFRSRQQFLLLYYNMFSIDVKHKNKKERNLLNIGAGL
jgi:hypothetical protein